MRGQALNSTTWSDGSSPARARTDRRRRHPWLVDVRYAFSGRRRQLRREEDRRSGASIVDWYPASLLVLAIATLVLSAVDAALTLVIINTGITTEANPFMQFLLEQGVPAFVGFKMLATGIGLVLLVAYSKVRTVGRLTMARALGLLCAFYACLVGYELFLLNLYIP